MWGQASCTHLSRDNCILIAPGTRKSHRKVRPPLQPPLRLQPGLQSLDPAEGWWDFCIQKAQTHENRWSSKGLQDFWKFHSWFFGSPLGNHGLNLQGVWGWLVLPKQHITAHSKAAGPAGRWEKRSPGRWTPTNTCYFGIMNYRDPFPPKLASVLYCSRFFSY